MAIIVPFRGLRYDTEKAGNMAELITPPYDVIDDRQQKAYYKKNPYNIIRLEYGETRPHDNEEDNRYTRARGFFTSWLQQGILRHEEKPSLYLYEQEFTENNCRLVRTGLIAGVGLEAYDTGMILPHEETLSKAKADRLMLLEHCRANFSAIFGLYDDENFTVEKLTKKYKQFDPVIAFTDENRETHRVWAISDADDLKAIKDFFRLQRIYIADGHHRYETALHFHQQQATLGIDKYNFCLMTLVNLHDPGLVIYPTHRLVKNLENFNRLQLLEKLKNLFDVQELKLPEENKAEFITNELHKLKSFTSAYNAYLLYAGDQKLYRLLHPRNAENKVMVKRYGAFSPQWRTLDVAVLQGLVFEEIFGIDSHSRAGGQHLTYTREEAGALSAVDAGKYQAVFFLNPTQVKEVTAVAAAGEKMPQKSTYFYPKLVTGLVINDFCR